MRQTASEDISTTERFIETLIEDAKKKKNPRLLIIEGVIVHGDPNRDIELTLLTVHGISDALLWIRDELTPKYSFIRGINTVSISYSHRWRAYAGQRIKPIEEEP
jgi:hypothetical protein